MPPRLLIIADDLTGANDTGVQFAKQGIDALVSIRHDQNWRAWAKDCQVLVVNTESRHINPDEAFQRVYDTVRQAMQLGISHFYKKTDSTLRGNLGSEFAALFEATGARELFFAPAYPKLHRTTRASVQFVNGVALHQSSFANDPLNPMHAASIAAIIAQQTAIQVRPFATLNAEAAAPTIFVIDAETDDDLRHAAHLLHHKLLLAGAGGWAEFLPAAMSLPTAAIAAPEIAGPVLVVNGSLHETSLRQIAHAAQHGWAVIEITPCTQAAEVIAAFQSAPGVALTTNAKLRCEHFTPLLANLVARILDQMFVPVLAVFGGDTLAAIAAARGWTAFRPRTELLPGVPFVEVCGQDEVLLLTKAGGFGSVDLLTNLSVQRA